MSPLGFAVHASSALGPAVLGATLLGAPVPLGVVVGGLAAHLALVGLAVSNPTWRAFGPAISSCDGGVALTFDDGPDPAHTPRVLDMLREHGAKATFFVVGERLVAHPALGRRIVDEGHALGAHGFVHDSFYALRGRATLFADMEREDAAHVDVVGRAPALFRPPIGVAPPPVVALASARGRSLVGWTVRPRDGLAGATADAVAARVLPRLREGAIVLLHDAAMGARVTPVAVDALPRILRELDARALAARAIDAPRDLGSARALR